VDAAVADPYAAIERRHRLAVPPAYREMVVAGLLDPYGRPDWRQLSSRRRMHLLKARALAGRTLYLPQVEWYPLDEICDFAPGTWADGLLPFAGNGAGDHWCWYTPWTTDGQVPIVFYDHEIWTGTAVAADFTACVYRLLLENFAEFTDTSFSLAELPDLLKAYTDCLRPFLPAALIATLNELSSRPAQVNADENLALLDRDEAQALMERDLAFSNLNRTFRATNY
jgi:hypothetical protein